MLDCLVTSEYGEPEHDGTGDRTHDEQDKQNNLHFETPPMMLFPGDMPVRISDMRVRRKSEKYVHQ